jgi:hypothetical protein
MHENHSKDACNNRNTIYSRDANSRDVWTSRDAFGTGGTSNSKVDRNGRDTSNTSKSRDGGKMHGQ